MTYRYRSRALASGLLLAGVLAACSDAPTGAAPADDAATLAGQVAALGFRADMVEDHGDFVLVEGDIYLSKAQLRTATPLASADPRGPRFQYRTTNLVSQAKVQQIVVDLSGLNSQTAWKSAAQTALAHWSGISNSNVRMVEGTPADITVATTCTSYNVAAFASFPSAGNPGSTIYVNTCFGYTTSNAQKVHNMVHELGHTLGFRHSNYVQQGETAGTDGAVHIGGTPTSGNAGGSVMNGGTALNSWSGFASSDLTAVRSLYPLPAPAASVSHPLGTVVVSWPAISGAYYYTVQRRYRHYVYNGYENRAWENSSEGSVATVYGTSYDSGASWTGESNCYYYDAYEQTTIDVWYEVRAVYANGTSSPTYVGAEDITC